MNDESGQSMAATYENVTKAIYPLSRLVYFDMIKSPDGGTNPVPEESLRFNRSREEQQIIPDQAICLPLGARQVESALEALE